MSKPDLEALITPRIAEAFQAAIDKIGRRELKTITGIDDQHVASILMDQDLYIPLALVTIVCQINKSHDDPNPAHSSVTECLKGSTLRIPAGQEQSRLVAQQTQRRTRIPNLYAQSRAVRTRETRPFRLLGFSVNTITFMILGYFLGGLLLSPLLGQTSCAVVSASPPSLNLCYGSVIGIILGAFGGLGYTYYYFVKKL